MTAALSEPVKKPRSKNEMPCGGKCQKWFCNGRKAVPIDDKRFTLPGFIRQPAGNHFKDAGSALGNPFYNTTMDIGALRTDVRNMGIIGYSISLLISVKS